MNVKVFYGWQMRTTEGVFCKGCARSGKGKEMSFQSGCAVWAAHHEGSRLARWCAVLRQIGAHWSG